MKSSIRLSFLLAAASAGSLPLSARYTFDGETNRNAFTEANWFDSQTAGDPAAGTFNPGVTIPTHPTDARIIIDGFSAAGVAFSDGTLDIGDNELQINNGRLTSCTPTWRGIRYGSGAGTSGTATVTGSSRVEMQFSLNLDWSIADSSRLVFNGGGNPVNFSTIDFAAGSNAVVHFRDETIAAATSEHAGKITVGGAVAVVGSNLFIVSDGGTGSYAYVADTADLDEDGLTNAEETTAGTSPVNADTDDDCENDGAEVAAATSPTNPADNSGTAGYVWVGVRTCGGDGSSLFSELNFSCDGDETVPYIVPPGISGGSSGPFNPGFPVATLPQGILFPNAARAGGGNGFGGDFNIGQNNMSLEGDAILRSGASFSLVGDAASTNAVVLRGTSKALALTVQELAILIQGLSSLVLYADTGAVAPIQGTSAAIDFDTSSAGFVEFQIGAPGDIQIAFGSFLTASNGTVTYRENFAGGTYAFSSEDTDGDTIPDGWENAHFGDLVTAGLATDTDGDNLSDADEHINLTDPNNINTDGDCFGDADEVAATTDPLDAGSQPATAGYVWVSDGDGISLFMEDNWSKDGDNVLPHIQPAAGTFDPNVPVPALPGGISILDATGVVGGGGGFNASFDIGDNPLTVGGTVFMRGNAGALAGIRSSTGGSPVAVTLMGETRTRVAFLDNLDVSLQDSASIRFYRNDTSGDDPIDLGTTIDFASGAAAALRFLDDDPATVTSNHLGDITVGEVAATVGVNLSLVGDCLGGSCLFLPGIDTDGDSMDDGWELCFFEDTTTAFNGGDADSDFLLDDEEFLLGTNPTLVDSDGDGLLDGDEVLGDPVNGFTSDPKLTDTDADGFDDALEVAQGNDPDDNTSAPAPVVRFFLSTPTILRDSGTVVLRWETEFAFDVTINDGSTDVVTGGAPNGSFTTATLGADTTFTITASNGIATDAAAVVTVDVRSGADPVSYEETVLADGPVAFWRFEEPAGTGIFFDSTNNGNDSTEIIGGITGGEPGAVGTAIRADGSGAVITGLLLDPRDPDIDDTTTDIDADGLEGWSIEAIVRPDDAQSASDQHIAANRDGTGTGRSDLYISEDGRLFSFLGGAPRPGTNPIADASWCHVVMTVRFDSGAVDPAAPYTIRFYIDGVLDSEITGATIEAANGAWVLASHKIQQANGFLRGGLDEVSIYDYPLDDKSFDGFTDENDADFAIDEHFAAFRQDAPPLLGLSADADEVDQGNSVTLSWKLGNSAGTAVLTDDGGNTIVADAIAANSVSVTPATTTTYTLTVDGSITQEVTVVVNITTPPRIIDIALVEIGGSPGMFDVVITATDLVPGTDYALEFSTDLLVPFTDDGTVVTAGSATETLTFSPVEPDGADPLLFFRVEKRLP